MSLASLPYDLVRLIATYLDPDPASSVTEAPSITRQRRYLGRRLALIAPNFREVGTSLVWRNVVVGFHRNPDLLERVLHEQWMASHIRKIHILAGKRNEAQALALDLQRLLPLLCRLDECVLSMTPDTVELLLEQAESATGVSSLLRRLPLFHGTDRIAVSLRLSPETPMPPALPAPVLQTRVVMLNIEDLVASPAAEALVVSYLSLFSLAHITSLKLMSQSVPDHVLRNLRQLSSLRHLSVDSKSDTVVAALIHAIDALPYLPELRSIELGVRTPTDEPARITCSLVHHRLFDAISAHPALEWVFIAVEFGLYDEEAGGPLDHFIAFLDRQLPKDGRGGSRFREWTSVAWDAALLVKRETTWLRVACPDGGERWIEDHGGSQSGTESVGSLSSLRLEQET
ncbi:hypothetical protein Rhopal_002499-T1 [Rhodotorula paludigena]|uniref:F-box domain-containing protein n=1 Tax=Rhodotorula paludigena TaxID=86838 RepID=A0AAV5GKE0_9BASI|nr:hypothetical protein Rhopal_002499-T1 [Rhodotorula paludigena]